MILGMLKLNRYLMIKEQSKTPTTFTNREIDHIAKELMNNYGDDLLRLAYSYVHNMADAQEILSDTILQYIKKAPTFNNDEHQKAWLWRVCINNSKNRLSYNKVRQSDELEENLAQTTQNNLAFVWDSVKALPAKYREVIHLFYYDGYTIEEISKLLGKNSATIRSLLFRGREKLKQILKEEYDFEE